MTVDSANHTGKMVFAPKQWDSDFFGRDIWQLLLSQPVEIDDLVAALVELDQTGAWGVEVEVKPERMADVSVLEEAGFRLVDSRMSFVSRMTVPDIKEIEAQVGQIRQAQGDDLESISKLTTQCFVDNPAFHSRFKNPGLYSRTESIRYYDAWNQRCFNDQPELFAVWEVSDEVVAYFNYMRVEHPELNPLFKGVLTAVNPGFRGKNAHNMMQSFLFKRFNEPEWWIDNTTQITNIAVIRNHIKAGKMFQSSSLIFFRISPSKKNQRN